MAIESARMAPSDKESMLNEVEIVYIVLADNEPEDYDIAMKSINLNEWKMACQKEISTLQSYNTRYVTTQHQYYQQPLDF